MKILKHGISFPPKPKLNISQVETQIYNVVRKLGLTKQFRDLTLEDKSIIKNTATSTPKTNKNKN